MGRAKRIQERRNAARKVPHIFANRWVVVGVDRWNTRIFENDTFPTDSSVSKTEAERIAEGINRRGGCVVLVEEYWNSPYAGYLPVGTSKRDAAEYIESIYVKVTRA